MKKETICSVCKKDCQPVKITVGGKTYCSADCYNTPTKAGKKK